MSLAGRVALVTGASQGIGRTCALRLAKEALAHPNEALAKNITTATGLSAFDLQPTAKNLYAPVFNYSVQVQARIDHYQNLTVPDAGLTVVFRPDGAAAPGAFNAGPPIALV